MHEFDHPYDERDLNYPDTLIIDVMSGEEALDRVVDDAGAAEADNGEQPPARRSFASVSEIRKLLTDRRVEILESLMAEQADSITELAERLDRTYSVVHDDIEVLGEYGIVKFYETEGSRSRGMLVPYETIEVDVTIRGVPETDGEKATA